MTGKENKKIIGLDIGGTKIRGILWDKNHKKVLKVSQNPTPKNLSGFKKAVEKTIKTLGRENEVAIGAAGIMEKRKLLKSPNIPYVKNLDFSFIGKSFNSKRLDNDARCFARAEYELGSAKGKKSVFFISLGTGVGRAVGRNGRILKVKKFEYPEKWEKQYQKVRDMGRNDMLAEYLNEKIRKLTKPYKPELIIVGGGISDKKGFFKDLLKRTNLPLKKSNLGENAAAIGAAILLP